MTEHPEWGTEDYRRYASLFNDISHAEVQRFIHLSDRQKIARYLWSQGWRREVRDEDVTETTGAASYPRQSVSWNAASSGDTTISHAMFGDEVFALVDGEWVKVGDNGWHLQIGPEGGALIAGPPPEECHCPPCPGRGNDGHRMTHCAECCFGSGVEADEGCPVHGRSAVTQVNDDA